MSGKLIKALRATPLYIWVILFTVLPLLLIVFYAFFEQQDGSMVFTLENFKAAITNVDYLRSMGISFRHAAVSTALCLLLGYPLAYILSELTERIRNFMVVLFYCPCG